VAASRLLILALTPQVDAAGFAEEMDAQKARAKAAARTVDLTAAGRLGALAAELGASEFVGWERMEAPGTVVAILRGGEPVDAASEGARGSSATEACLQDSRQRVYACTRCEAVRWLIGMHVLTISCAVVPITAAGSQHSPPAGWSFQARSSLASRP